MAKSSLSKLSASIARYGGNIREVQQLLNDGSLLKQYGPDIVEQNRKQMSRSRRADNQPIKPLYSPRYAKKKGFFTPDLHLTGRFYRSLYVDKNAIISNDPKARFLVGRYEGILGINPQFRTHLTGRIRGDIVKILTS